MTALPRRKQFSGRRDGERDFRPALGRVRRREWARSEVMKAPRRKATAEVEGVFLQASEEFEGSQRSPDSEEEEQKKEEENPALPPAAIASEEALPGGPSPASAASLAVEDMQRLMAECGLGLESVTQALLKNSGEVGAASCCLRTGQRPDGAPLWSRQDDRDLLQGERDLRRRLEQRFGAENVAKREAFRRS